MAHAPTQKSVSLVLTLCHEVGNELAAARLSASWGAREADAEQRALAAAAVDVSLARAGALLSEIRPLLTGVAGRAGSVDPGEVLSTVRRELQPLQLGAMGPEIRIPRRAPRVRAEPLSLCALLVDRVLRACVAAEGRQGGPIRLAGRRRDGRFVLRIDGLRAGGADAGWLERARAMLRPVGGRVDVREHRGLRALELALALAPVARRRPASRAPARISAR